MKKFQIIHKSSFVELIKEYSDIPVPLTMESSDTTVTVTLVLLGLFILMVMIVILIWLWKRHASVDYSHLMHRGGIDDEEGCVNSIPNCPSTLTIPNSPSQISFKDLERAEEYE